MGVTTNGEWSYSEATPYEVLGVSVCATDAEVKAAWRKLTQIAHPDHGGTSALFELTQNAYELLVDSERRHAFDQGSPAQSTFRAGQTSSSPGAESHYDHGPASPPRNDDPYRSPRQPHSKAPRKTAKFSLAWLLVLVTNFIAVVHYRAIVAANQADLANASRSSFMVVKPWHESVAALTFLRGDLWIRYASLVFLSVAFLEYSLKDSPRAPSWLQQHYVTVRRITFTIGLAISAPLLITGVLWGMSIAVTLALIAVALTLVVVILFAV